MEIVQNVLVTMANLFVIVTCFAKGKFTSYFLFWQKPRTHQERRTIENYFKSDFFVCDIKNLTI